MTGMGLDTPPHPKSLKAHLQNITGDIFQATKKQLMTPTPSLNSPTVSVNGQDGLAMFSKTFLGPL